MTKSHGHQQISLFNGLLKRAQKGQPGLSKGAMVLAYDFDDEAQLDHALAALCGSEHISIDIDGRFPSIRLFKNKYHCAIPLKRPLFLSSGLPRPRTEAAPAPAAPPAPVATLPAPEAAAHPAVPLPVPVASTVEASLRMEDAAGPPVARQVAFRVADGDLDWLMAELETTPDSLSFSGLCKQLFQAELDRRRTADGPKHKVSASVIRAARDEGRDLGEFVTSLIAIGMHAREMNRKGL